MKKVLPHEFFYLDFKQILEEGRRQEDIYHGNVGEFLVTAGTGNKPAISGH